MSFASKLILADGTHGDTTTWIALGAGMLLFAYIVLRPRGKKDPLEKASSFSSTSLAQQRSVERQMNTLLVELSEMWRTISAGIDTRAAKLQVLMDEADRRIAQLQQLQNGSPPIDQAAPEPKTTERSELLAPMTEPARPADVGSTTHRIEPAHESTHDSAHEPGPDERHTEIYALADQGRSPADIAALLDRQRGEIELILALRPPAPRSLTA
jgi:hypothetical protein